MPVDARFTMHQAQHNLTNKQAFKIKSALQLFLSWTFRNNCTENDCVVDCYVVTLSYMFMIFDNIT